MLSHSPQFGPTELDKASQAKSLLTSPELSSYAMEGLIELSVAGSIKSAHIHSLHGSSHQYVQGFWCRSGENPPAPKSNVLRVWSHYEAHMLQLQASKLFGASAFFSSNQDHAKEPLPRLYGS